MQKKLKHINVIKISNEIESERHEIEREKYEKKQAW